MNTTSRPHVTTPLFCLALGAVCKSVTKSRGEHGRLAAFRAAPFLRDTPGFPKDRTEPSSLSQLDTPTLTNKKKIFANPEQSKRSQLSVCCLSAYGHINTQIHQLHNVESPTLTACFKIFGVLAASSLLFIRRDSQGDLFLLRK